MIPSSAATATISIWRSRSEDILKETNTTGIDTIDYSA